MPTAASAGPLHDIFIGQQRKLEDRVTRCDQSDRSQCPSKEQTSFWCSLCGYYSLILVIMLGLQKNVKIPPNSWWRWLWVFVLLLCRLCMSAIRGSGGKWSKFWSSFSSGGICSSSGIWHVCSAETTTELISGTDAVAVLHKSSLMMQRFFEEVFFTQKYWVVCQANEDFGEFTELKKWVVRCTDGWDCWHTI